MIKYVREGRVPNVMAIFMIFCKDKGLLYANMWKGVRNKGRWLGQAYKGTAEITLELYLLKKNLSEVCSSKCTKKEQTLVQV